MSEVMFRKYKDGDILAVFPYEATTRQSALYGCMCYQHIGQHGSGDYHAMIDQTKPASADEYADLLAELKRIGYDDLKIITRRSHDKARRSYNV